MITIKHTTGKRMMKVITCAAFCVLQSSLFILTSCDDYLTDDPNSQITPEEAYGSLDALKKNAVLSIYNYIGGADRSQGLQGTDRGVYDLNSFSTDEQLAPVRGSDWYDGGLWYRLFFHKWTAGEAPLKDTWDYLYKVVMLCNEGIERIDAFQTDDKDEQLELDKYKAELRSIRAMYYFYLMDLYGRVPLVTSTGIKSSEMTLCDRKTLFYWIYDELSDALNNMKSEWSQFKNSEYYGRMTAYVSYFVMMKLAINAEVYNDNDWTDNARPNGKDIILKSKSVFNHQQTTELNAWETVRHLFNEISPYYELSANYTDNFSIHNENSKENIFVIPMDPLLYSNRYCYAFRSLHYCHGAALKCGSENGPCATVSTIKAFGYDEKGESIPDGRFFLNFHYDYAIVNNKMVYEEDGVTPLHYKPLAVTEFDLSGEIYEKTAGARIYKYEIDPNSFADGRLINNDIVLFRYADMVLMYAEACYRLGENEEALNALNMVYNRSNNFAYAKPYTEVNDDNLLRERLMEFMWEGWRRNDLIRFGRFNKPYDLKTDASDEADGHTIVFPIPADMMVMHPDWKQNPGY